jgi:DNA invertase Pin-like site-specific DNA recombinase
MGHGGLEPAVGYVRVSMAREEMVSPELQRAAVNDRAGRDGYRVTEWIEELDVSGRGFARVGVQRAIQQVRDGAVRRVYVWKYSRFGRNATLVGVHVGEIEAAGGELVSATEDVDARTAAGKFARGMLWQVDEFYSDLIGENWRGAHRRRRDSGLPHNGYPRFGYAYHSSPITGRCAQGCEPGACQVGYSPDPAAQDHAAHMFDLYNTGTSVLKIAVHLNSLGLQTPAGKPWEQRAVRKYMDSGFAAGLLRVHDPSCDHATSEAAQACKKPKVLIPGAHDAIITEDVWLEYQRQRGARAKLPPRVEAAVYPLAGLVRCGRCDSPMNAHGMVYKGVGHRGYLYQCTKYARSRECAGTWIARHRVEDVALAWLDQFAEDIDAAARAQRSRMRVRATADLDRKRLQGQIEKTDAALTRLAIQLARELIDEEPYKAAKAELDATRTQAKAHLDALTPPPPDTAPMRQVAAGLVKEWNTLSPAARRGILGEMIDHVTVTSHGKSRATIEVTAVWGEVTVYDI